MTTTHPTRRQPQTDWGDPWYHSLAKTFIRRYRMRYSLPCFGMGYLMWDRVAFWHSSKLEEDLGKKLTLTVLTNLAGTKTRVLKRYRDLSLLREKERVEAELADMLIDKGCQPHEFGDLKREYYRRMNEARVPPPPKYGYVYLSSDGRRPAQTKVGRTIDPSGRARTHRTSGSLNPVVVFQLNYDDHFKVEARIKAACSRNFKRPEGGGTEVFLADPVEVLQVSMPELQLFSYARTL